MRPRKVFNLFSRKLSRAMKCKQQSSVTCFALHNFITSTVKGGSLRCFQHLHATHWSTFAQKQGKLGALGTAVEFSARPSRTLCAHSCQTIYCQVIYNSTVTTTSKFTGQRTFPTSLSLNPACSLLLPERTFHQVHPPRIPSFQLSPFSLILREHHHCNFARSFA